MSLMEKFADPEIMLSLSLGEKLAGSTVTMIMGMGITFLVLVILWAFIEIMGRIVMASERKSVGTERNVRIKHTEKGTGAACEAKDRDEETAAVICAAVSAYEASSAGKRFEVRRISRRNEAVMVRRKVTDDCMNRKRIPWMDAGRKCAGERELRHEKV